MTKKATPKTKATKTTRKAKTVKAASKVNGKANPTKAAPVDAKAKQPKEPTKKQQVIDLLNRPEGVTLNHIMEEMKWLRHTTHGFFAALRKKGTNIVTSKESGQEPVYRIAA